MKRRIFFVGLLASAASLVPGAAFAEGGTHIGTMADAETCAGLAKLLNKMEPSSEYYCSGKEMYWKKSGGNFAMVEEPAY
jgi:hypothetical protein